MLLSRSKEDDGATTITKYVYEYDKVILELDGNGNDTASNVYANGVLISRSDSETGTMHYLYNGHGDVTAITESLGNVVMRYYYDAFGVVLEANGNVDNSYMYSGYQYDAETGFYYLNSRYYDPATARFMSADTYLGSIGSPLSLNLYTHCSNNPVKYWDPSGHKPVFVSGVGYYDDVTWEALYGPEYTDAPGAGSAFSYAEGPNAIPPLGSVNAVVPNNSDSSSGTTSNNPEDYAYWVPGIGWFEKGTNRDLWQDPRFHGVYPGDTLNVVGGGTYLKESKSTSSVGTTVSNISSSSNTTQELPAKVLLPYIVQKNGGSIKIVPKTMKILGLTGYYGIDYIEVTIGDLTIKYYGADEEIVDGHMLIDPEKFGKDFGITDYILLTHQPGDMFKTIDDAAFAWGLMYNQLSIENKWEYASAIYKNGYRYSFTEIFTNELEHTVTRQNATDRVATIHSHGAYDDEYVGEDFSPTDKENADYDSIPSYLTTPGGKLLKYDPNKWINKTTTINKNLYKDPNYKWRLF